MLPYPKIETLYERDRDTFKVDTSRIRRPEFQAIDRWVITEKVDGTNIRLGFVRNTGQVLAETQIHGRTDNAQIPSFLLEQLRSIVNQIEPEVQKIMDEHGLEKYTLYGEGYGARIQKGGGNYIPDGTDFILFDVLVGERSWLSLEAVTETAKRLGLRRVPVLAEDVSPAVAAAFCRGGFESCVAEKSMQAEGIVATPAVPLYNNRGDRVIWKLKKTDF